MKSLPDCKTEEKVLNLLSFASRMGKLIYGKEKLERYLFSKGDKLLFMASDSSLNTQKYWINKCEPNDIDLLMLKCHSKSSLAKRLGKNELSVVSTSNQDIINGIKKIMRED